MPREGNKYNTYKINGDGKEAINKVRKVLFTWA